jgi:hypothetical protein
MAVFVQGKTACPLCTKVIQPDEDSITFPPLFLNSHHRVFEVNDAVVHRACLLVRPYGESALAKLATYEERAGQPRTCRVCGRDISDPDDYFTTGPLADDASEGVSRLDWFDAHESCLHVWPGTPALIQDLIKFARSDDWEGDVLTSLATRLQAVCVGT